MKHRSNPTSTPLHQTFYVMISVTFECEGNPNWPFLLQVDISGEVFVFQRGNDNFRQSEIFTSLFRRNGTLF
jgi:hypothetical protein